ncbi:MAG: radical SAM protein [Fusobacteriaceae bacterium]|nr:radical SAM protein [Fusobacteriaceae bacterium]
MKIYKYKKYLNLLVAHSFAKDFKTTPFVRIIPSDVCNLSCEYCWQHSNTSIDMTEIEYKSIIKKAKSMKVGMITFLGGEPLLWCFIYDAIKLCSKLNILTDLTTNGTLLNENTINKLAKNGLDYLNISVDGISTIKNITCIEKNIVFLKKAREKYGMKIRVNSVLKKNNFEEIKILIEFLHKHKIPISIGYVIPSFDKSKEKNVDFFSEDDKYLIEEIICFMKGKIQDKYKIIEPLEYFENIYKYFSKEEFWKCNYSTAYGWINIIGGYKLRSCTKKMDKLEYNYLELKSSDIKEIKELFLKNIQQCNRKCYSNCAYDSYYYSHNKWKLIKKMFLN